MLFGNCKQTTEKTPPLAFTLLTRLESNTSVAFAPENYSLESHTTMAKQARRENNKSVRTILKTFNVIQNDVTIEKDVIKKVAYRSKQ